MCDEEEPNETEPEANDVIESTLLLVEAVNRLRYSVCKVHKLLELQIKSND